MGNKYVLSKYLQNIGLFAVALLLCLLLLHTKGYAYSKPPIPTSPFHPSIIAPGDSYNASDVVGQPDFTSNNPGLSQSALDVGCCSIATAIDKVHHRLFVGDSYNDRVLVYQLNNKDQFTDGLPHNATYVLGQTDFISNLYNLDQHSVSSMGMVYDQVNNRLFVEDEGNSRILVFSLSSGITNGMDASYVIGQPDFTTNYSGVTQNQFSQLYAGIAYDNSNGYLFVYEGERIMVFNVNPGNISNGMNASYVIGQPDFTTMNGPFTNQNSFYAYYGGLVFDNVHKRLFVTDEFTFRVLVFDLSSGITNNMNASYVLGQSGFTIDTSQYCIISSVNPQGIGYDEKNQALFIEDNSCNRVLIFDLSSGITNNMNASMVLGQPDLTSSNGYPVSQSSISADYSNNIAFDTTNNTFYYTDGDNRRSLIFNFVKISQDILPNPSLNQAYSQTISHSNSQGTVTYSLSSGVLPPGLSFDPATGLISGTPTTSGSYTFSITAKDDNGTVGYYKDTNTYTLTVSAKTPATGFGINSNNPTLSILIFTAFAIAISATGVFIRKLNKA
ncbi:MAG: putative Ig domain-containing protein [bacterium]